MHHCVHETLLDIRPLLLWGNLFEQDVWMEEESPVIYPGECQNVTTLSECRKQGIGRALTLAPLLEARASGYRIGVLQSTQMGLNLYRSIGFREYCTFSVYFSPELQDGK